MGKFAKKIGEFNSKTEKALEMLLRGTALDLMSAIVMRTPVGNPDIWKTKYPPKGYTGGRLRGNWQAEINRPASGTSKKTDKRGSKTLKKGQAKMKGATVGDSIYITNNLPYAIAVENGHSRQAPKGMVKITIAELKMHLRRNARKAK